jgi:hypothetical protein
MDWRESVRRAAKVKGPVAVGVPVMAQLGSRRRPGARAPEVSSQVKGAMPPAVREAE